MKLLLCVLIIQVSFAQELSQHYYKERVITIHADSSEAKTAQKQVAAFLFLKKEMVDRKLVLYNCDASTCTFYDFFETPKSTKTKDSEHTFEIRLYGLDGQIKFEANQYIAPQELFALIDKMPMRRNEMRKRIKKEGYE